MRSTRATTHSATIRPRSPIWSGPSSGIILILIIAWMHGRAASSTNSRIDDTLAILTTMMQAINSEFAYNPRDEMGTQEPLVTMESGTGTCRDFALFMMEAARSLGFAARFVSGYLYDEDRLGGERRDHRRRRNPRLGADLSAGRWMGRIRPDQRADRRSQPDPSCGDA